MFMLTFKRDHPIDGARHSGAPNATVVVDGHDVGSTPAVVRPLAPGAHDLVVHSDGYDPFRQRVEIGPGQMVTVRAQLRRNPAAGGSRPSPSTSDGCAKD